MSIAVAIVTFGYETDEGKAAMKLLDKHDIPYESVVDLRQVLRDPKTERVKFQVDGSHEWTQRAVYVQSNWPEVITESVKEIDERAGWNIGCVNLACCRTGFHRADTYGRTIKACMNRIELNGTRVFNVQHFPLHGVGAKEVGKVLDLAVKWTEDPWGIVRGGKAVPKSELYAYDACCTRPSAMENFHAIYKYVDEFQTCMHMEAIDMQFPSPTLARLRANRKSNGWVGGPGGVNKHEIQCLEHIAINMYIFQYVCYIDISKFTS